MNFKNITHNTYLYGTSEKVHPLNAEKNVEVNFVQQSLDSWTENMITDITN